MLVHKVVKCYLHISITNFHELFSPLRIEQRKFEDRLAALEKLSRERSSNLQTEANTIDKFPKGLSGHNSERKGSRLEHSLFSLCAVNVRWALYCV